ncbi:phosphatase PAP2 family protein [Sporolactobacillus kofuensis]|uniref:Phosphatase PAP2 family protein n=1 Tax=Sporolactobacillus kofuensis TaxID=269672 RepID=A0ABW1WE82_9BACL|nr:phosphatase PAP2 family protein [Sporolactobacillus kofuensis]MCO7176010.1 phosphatase PAP2 family protein [Sporolactobacillus kofuensis]
MQHDHRLAYKPWLWVVLFCVLFFLLLVIAIRQPGVQALDLRLVQILDPLRAPGAVAFFSKVTDLGSSRVLINIMILFIVYFLFRKHFLSAILLPIAFLAERPMNELLKSWVMRERPPFHHLVHARGYSFPSGHAMNAATVFGLLILLVVPLIKSKGLRIAWAVLGMAMILLIGFSRPFLRVHYFTDILAGYCAGGFLVGISAVVLIFVYNRKR